MRARRLLLSSLSLLAALAVFACDPDEPPGEEAPAPEPEPEPELPPCDEPGSLYGIDLAREHVALSPGVEVPVLLGFQGFLFLEVGLGSPLELPGSMDVFTRVQLEGGADLSATTPGIRAVPVGAGWESDPVLVFFNDLPLVELHGKHATLTASAATATCILSASAEVRLVDGGAAAP